MKLKPKPAQKIDLRRILVMTLCFSVYGFIGLIIKALLFNELDWPSIFIQSGYIALAFFIWFNLVTAQLWNIRARELQAQGEA